jgi:hypothetical protein
MFSCVRLVFFKLFFTENGKHVMRHVCCFWFQGEDAQYQASVGTEVALL